MNADVPRQSCRDGAFTPIEALPHLNHPAYRALRRCEIAMAPIGTLYSVPLAVANNEHGPLRVIPLVFLGDDDFRTTPRTLRSSPARLPLVTRIKRDAAAPLSQTVSAAASLASGASSLDPITAHPADGSRSPTGSDEASPLGARAGVIAFLAIAGVVVIGIFWLFVVRRVPAKLWARLHHAPQEESAAPAVGLSSKSSSGTDASVELTKLPRPTERLHTATSTSSFAPLIKKPADGGRRTPSLWAKLAGPRRPALVRADTGDASVEDEKGGADGGVLGPDSSRDAAALGQIRDTTA